MKTRPTQSQLELEDLLRERDSYRAIDGLHRLDMDGLSRLLRMGHSIFGGMPEFRSWFLGIIRKEVQVRASDGSIERGRYVFPADSFSDDDLIRINHAVDCFRDADMLSREERDVIVSIHRQVQSCIAIRLTSAAEGHVRLLTADQVCDLLSIPKLTMKRLIDQGKLPKPVVILPKVHRWRHDRVMECLESMK